MPAFPPTPATAAATPTCRDVRQGARRNLPLALPLALRRATLARALRRGALPIVALLGAVSAAAAPGAVVKTDQVRAELVAHAPEGVAPGKPLWLGLRLEHAPQWHTYWKNPGDSGLATTLQWTLPAGFAAGEIAWPTPRPLPVGPLMNFGYEGTLLLPVAVTVPASFAGDALAVTLRADWLVCREVCIPEGGDFALQVPARAAISLHAALFEGARAQQPRALPPVQGSARVDGDALVVRVAGIPADLAGRALRLLPELAGVIDNAAPPQARWEGSTWEARVPLSAQRSESPAALAAVLVLDTSAGTATGTALSKASTAAPPGLQLALPVSGAWPAAAVSPVAPVGMPAGPSSAAIAPTDAAAVALSLLLAFLGGALLNLMPCVFPVLSLKVLGLAAHGAHAVNTANRANTPHGASGGDARAPRRALLAGGVAYTGGVVVSFVVLAGLLLALRAGGEQLGWGFQLQSPAFVAALAALFTLIGLNLAGLFEFGSVLPGSLAALRARHPVADSALTGVLAVAVASPCTAPFMGASLGLAVTLPAPQALAIFAALGLGMASPYLLACLWPGLARRLPRPGVWMARFKVLMAFPMFATVIWLVWVLGQQAGIDAVAGVLGVLLALAFAAWALGTPGFGRRARVGFGAVAVGVLGLALAWALPGLRPTTPAALTAAAGAGSTESASRESADGRWQAWSPEREREALAQGRPVFVDYTAAWCVTCQFNKRTALADAQVLADFAARGVVLLRADWTQRDPRITQALAALGRNGVPVYALMSPGAAGPRLLSEILSVRELREAIAALP
jgi:thiol:disulfide interchange protein/DsbC/DsbD-like thiol-disulfide interchange protein